ncbi:MAG: rhomboid family intramembrane serine protease, partial [Anaerolineales bacterium]
SEELSSSEAGTPTQFVRLPQRRPFVVYALLGMTIFVFILQILTDNGFLFPSFNCPYFPSSDIPACYGLKVNELILEGQWWRLITPVVLHASILHIAFNMYALNILGRDLEQYFGHFQFLALYLLSGFAGVVLSFLLTEAPSLGASTSVFGLLGAQGVFAYRNQRVFGPRARAALRSIINITVINLLIGLTPRIDNWGHVGGLLGGLVFCVIAGPVYELSGEGEELTLKNKTPEDRVYLASITVGVIFAFLAMWRAFFVN